MRRFSSYGPINPKLHYHTPREALIDQAYANLVGENPDEGGHYFTVWAPRQAGKTWVMQQVLHKLRKAPRYDVLKINLEILKDRKKTSDIFDIIARKIGEGLGKPILGVDSQDKFQDIFKKETLQKPLILILDEFDAMIEKGITAVVSAFRNIYIQRVDEVHLPTEQKSYLLHGIALIGVRSVLGIENKSGSPFNVQRSLKIPNLTLDEIKEMLQWYQKDSGQKVEEQVAEQLFCETRGQPGLIGWFGELLTETYNKDKTKPIAKRNFDITYSAALNVLPNNNVLNIISKAKMEPYVDTVLELFKTDQKIPFTYRNPRLNFLYMNGVIDKEEENQLEYYVRFASPFVQRCLFDYFSDMLFQQMDRLVDSFADLGDTLTETELHIRGLGKRYQAYLVENRDWLFKDAPRRKDLRVFEAVFHFNFYSYLVKFLRPAGGRVVPEFPTGNGKIDLLITYAGERYGIELKTFSNTWGYKAALEQAAKYGNQLKLKEIYLLFFVDAVDAASRQKYEADYKDKATGVTVKPFFITTL
ncbi:MAG: AAA family ATPase [bacterium]|nr:AAA family ATPase [bacterium]